jgi:hypothetical protein
MALCRHAATSSKTDTVLPITRILPTPLFVTLRRFGARRKVPPVRAEKSASEEWESGFVAHDSNVSFARCDVFQQNHVTGM